MQSELKKDRDLWKSKAEKLAEALRAMQHGTDWYVIKEIAQEALAAYVKEKYGSWKEFT